LNEVAIVVCTRDRPHLLRGLIPFLVEAQREGAEVVVVDSASRETATHDVATEAGLRVVRCDLPGASRARNLGARSTVAPVLAFTDDDCQPRAGWQITLQQAVAEGGVGFATGRVLAGGGDGRPISLMTDDQAVRWTARDDVAAMGHGANMAVRREAFDAVGGFDELLGAGAPLRGAEDKDLFWRVLRAGWDGVFVPEAVVDHVSWRDTSGLLRAEYGYGVGSGARTVKVARLAGERALPHVLRASRAALGQIRSPWRSGQRFAAVVLTAHALGIVSGGVRAARRRLADGRFVL
jgi:glycosyltransferase involved in cell wall biosynthesis